MRRIVVIKIPTASSAPQKKKILLVDDEPSFVGFVADYLRTVGFEVGTAGDGAEGLRKFQEDSWDLVITDRGMPEMDGDEMITAIKAICPGVPIILMTGLPLAASRHRRSEAILFKPFQRDELLAVVQAALGSTSLQPIT